MVTTAGSPSGIAATARATAICKQEKYENPSKNICQRNLSKAEVKNQRYVSQSLDHVS